MPSLLHLQVWVQEACVFRWFHRSFPAFGWSRRGKCGAQHSAFRLWAQFTALSALFSAVANAGYQTGLVKKCFAKDKWFHATDSISLRFSYPLLLRTERHARLQVTVLLSFQSLFAHIRMCCQMLTSTSALKASFAVGRIPKIILPSQCFEINLFCALKEFLRKIQMWTAVMSQKSIKCVFDWYREFKHTIKSHCLLVFVCISYQRQKGHPTVLTSMLKACTGLHTFQLINSAPPQIELKILPARLLQMCSWHHNW